MEKKQTCLVTERLVLKPFSEDHRQQMLDLLFDKRIKETYMLPDFETREQAAPLFERLMAFSNSDDHFLYGVFFGAAVVGFINDCEKTDSVMELGYVIAPEHQNKGYATEAVRACIQELFRMGYQQVKAGYFAGNTPSCRVMEKCGMRKLDFEEDIEYKGVLRHCFYYAIDR